MRVITVTSRLLPDGKVAIAFNPEEYTDSEALHEVLLNYTPGSTYTVSFKDV